MPPDLSGNDRCAAPGVEIMPGADPPAAGTPVMTEHRHWFVVHRHDPWPRHKPHPGRWHAHIWWRHTHA